MSEQKSSTRKKIIIGCSVTAVLILIILVVAVYFVIHKAKSIMESTQLEPPQYVELLEKDNFVIPAGGIIKEKDLLTYLKVSREIRDRIETEFATEESKFDWQSKQNYLQILAKILDIRKIQIEVLKENDFSVRKFKWITRQLVIIFGGDLVKQMNTLIKIRQSDQTEIDSSKEIRDIPQENLDLFNKYEDEITEVMALWVLGI